VLDEYQVVMHSSDSIAPVGVLHPLAFHLENKADDCSLKRQDKIHEICMQKLGSVFEVHDSLERFEAECKPLDCTYPINVVEHKFNISRTNNMNTFSICCSLQDSCSGNNYSYINDLSCVILFHIIWFFDKSLLFLYSRFAGRFKDCFEEN
jgi:diphthine-ammonia ligase